MTRYGWAERNPGELCGEAGAVEGLGDGRASRRKAYTSKDVELRLGRGDRSAWWEGTF